MVYTGETPIEHNGKKVVAFLESGEWTVPDGVTRVDVLVVAGGGSGGAGNHVAGGGGGAGGVIFEEDFSITDESSPISITVGDGGEGVEDSSRESGNKGENSVFLTLTAIGGGGGGGRESSANDGGSGGGGGHHGDGIAGSTEDSTQGYDGGDAGAWDGSWYRTGGGGGGSGENGNDATSSACGDGGDGLDYSTQFGTTYGEDGVFAGGGGGSDKEHNNPGSGGLGGGGDGASYDVSIPTEDINAKENTGGGGGATNAEANSYSGNGGSGIVIIAYEEPFEVTTNAATNVSFESATLNGEIGGLE